jgi:hypothetical protein
MTSVYETLLDASFYLLFGLIAAGMIKAWVNEKRMVRSLGMSSFQSTVKAALIGVPLPLCSCSVVPMALSIREKGASRGATVSFLISTPESGVDSIAVSYALLDPLMTVFRPAAAMITAVMAGVIENHFGKSRTEQPAIINNATETSNVPSPCQRNDYECECPTVTDSATIDQSEVTFSSKLKTGFRYAFVELLGDIAVYFLIGLLISGVLSVFIPDDWFMGQSDWMVMALMLVIGIPMYVCASASTPVAAALILKGISPGAALVFLLVGPATNIATLSIVARTLGARSAAIYCLTIAALAVILGVSLNFIYQGLGITPSATMGSGAELLPEWIKMISSVVLGMLILYYSARKLFNTRTK